MCRNNSSNVFLIVAIYLNAIYQVLLWMAYTLKDKESFGVQIDMWEFIFPKMITIRIIVIIGNWLHLRITSVRKTQNFKVQFRNFIFNFYLFIFGCTRSSLQCMGFSCSGLWALELTCSIVVAHRFSSAVLGLSYPAACGILAPWPGMEPASPALEGRLSTMGPPGKSLEF